MFSHVMIGANDVSTAKKFYDATLGVLGIPEGKMDDKGRVFYRTPTGLLGIANGGTACEDPPGLREGPIGKIYLAYLRDPSDNKICVLKRMY